MLYLRIFNNIYFITCQGQKYMNERRKVKAKAKKKNKKENGGILK